MTSKNAYLSLVVAAAFLGSVAAASGLSRKEDPSGEGSGHKIAKKEDASGEGAGHKLAKKEDASGEGAGHKLA